MIRELSDFEKTGGMYTEVDGIIYPNIILEEEEALNVGKYGLLWIGYMEENHNDRYHHQMRMGCLQRKAYEVNEEVYEMLEVIMDRSENIISVVVDNVFPLLDERCRRLLAGSLAIGYGYGGQKLVCHYLNLSQQTLCKAVAAFKNEEGCRPPCTDKFRRSGAGRKNAFEKHPGLIDFIDSILQENTYGNPMSVIAYSSLSLRDIAKEVSARMGIHISRNIVSKTLDMLDTLNNNTGFVHSHNC